MEVNDPVIVVEVISPSSRGVDPARSSPAYFSLPSVRHYLIVDTDKRVVIHHHRDGKRSGSASAIVREDQLSLDPRD